MIRISVGGRSGRITSLEIIGHAGLADSGKDLACAGVSSIGIGALNALDELCRGSCELEMTEAVRIRVIKDSEAVQLILNTAVIQLKTIMEKYPGNIRMIRKEAKS